MVLLATDGPEFTLAVDPADPALDEALEWLRRPDLLSIAALRGHVRGAALTLALACDLRVLADDGELSVEAAASFAGIGALTRLVGPAKALELCGTGRSVSAAQAAALGLVNQVVPAGAVQDCANDLAAAILAQPRDVVIGAKVLIAGAGSRTDRAQCEAERSAQASRLCDFADTVE